MISKQLLNYLKTIFVPINSISPGCFVYRDSAQTCTSSSATAMSYNTELNDNGDCWSSGDPTKLYAPADGFYIAGGSVSFATTARNKVYIEVVKNLTNVYARSSCDWQLAASPNLAVASGRIWLDAGDYISIRAYHATGTDQDTLAASSSLYSHNCGWIVAV